MTGSWNDFNDAQNTSIMPKGEIVKVRLTIRPGGHDDPSQGWTGGYATRGDSGAVYLNAEFTVLEGPYARRKIFTLIGLYSPKGPEWANMGRALIRGILNSARGISDKDTSAQGAGGTADQRLPGPRRPRVPRPRRRRRGRQRRSEERDPQGDHARPPGLRQAHGRRRSHRTGGIGSGRRTSRRAGAAEVRHPPDLGAVTGRHSHAAQTATAAVRRAQRSRARRTLEHPGRGPDRGGKNHHVVGGCRRDGRQ